MLVSIILITRNQERFIGKAIESILFQKIKGEAEIIIADDCSSDRTLDIIKEHEVKSRSIYRFIYLPVTTNIGHAKNYERAFLACKGEFIAILEGDDYWTTPSRVQRHIEFLKEHHECALSVNKYVILENGHFKSLENNLNDNNVKYYNIDQTIVENRIGNLSACVLRGDIVRILNQNIFDFQFDDWLLGIAMCEHGMLAQMNYVMSVYRKHPEGLWSGLSHSEQMSNILNRCNEFDRLFEYKYTRQFSELHQNIYSSFKSLEKEKRNYDYKDLIPSIIFELYHLFIPRYFRALIRKTLNRER